jgi:hypothetical protein
MLRYNLFDNVNAAGNGSAPKPAGDLFLIFEIGIAVI